MFGFLFLKNLLPDIADHRNDNHNEIGHIHFYRLQDRAQKNLNYTFEKASNSQQANDDDENCSSGKSAFSHSLFPSEVYKIVSPGFGIAFAPVLKIQNEFLAPDPETRRKPPRLA